MATSLLNLTFTNATDAEFRAWGLAISNALTSFGLTKTADTGQVDFATTLRPTNPIDFSRYEIRQFTDLLQTSLPIFIKITYGSGNATSNLFHIQVGTSTNGTGVLGAQSTPVVSNAQAILSIVNQTVTTPCYLSGSSNRLGIVLFAGTANSTFFFLERSKTTVKADTSKAAHVFKNSPAAALRNNYFMTASGAVVEEISGIHTPTVGVSATSANKSATYPNIFYEFGFAQEPGITHFAHYLNDNSAIGSPYTIVINGISRTYVSFGSNGSVGLVSRGSVAGIILTMLYE